MIELLIRRREMAAKPLPYDAEVEYLESTGTQYIDTGFKHNQDTRIECDISFNTKQSYQYAFGSFGATSSYTAVLSTEINNSYILGTYYGRELKYSDNVLNINTKYHYDLNKNIHTINNYTSVFTYFNFTSIYNDILFGYTNYSGNVGCAKVKIFYFKLYDNGALIRDFIPVRVGTVGYMYDKVSGQLFGNEGTGSFVVGRDKGLPYDAEVEYLQSSGTQWIDTGLYGSNDLTTTLTFQLSSTSGSKGVFGVYENNKNYYVYQAAGNYWQVGFGSYGNASIQTNTNKHTMVFGNNSVALDGTTIFTGSGSSFTSTQTLVLFNMHNGSGGTYSATGMKVFGAKFEKNGVTVMDLIPVRTDGVGYMYDKVSGTLFGNAGSGAFTYGNDVNT